MACIEPIEFDTSNEEPKLVVQGYISTLSYRELSSYPIEPQLFNVKLSWTSPVSNEKDLAASGAFVMLVDLEGNMWNYQESIQGGVYFLYDMDFKAEPGKKYKLIITLPDGKQFESGFEEVKPAPGMGEVTFEEVEYNRFIDVNGVSTLVTVKGVDVKIAIPENDKGKLFYRWELTPSWIYVASRASDNSLYKTCWVTSDHYFDEIILKEDRVGGYKQDLFFIETSNTRIKHEFSVFIKQHSMSEDNFQFWQDLKLQGERGSIFDPPPYNIRSNITPINNNEEAVGYFQVLDEKVQRWYFSLDDLSYRVSYDDPCIPPPGFPAFPEPECLNCLKYRSGGNIITNTKPFWWR